MKKLLTIILLIMSVNAWAEWTLSGGSDEFTQYIDIATIRRNGNFVKMWNMQDFKTVRKSASNDSYLSSKVQMEYDCKEERTRMLAFTWFTGQMGNGKVVYSDSDPGKWQPIYPGSIGETLWDVACFMK
jgi:hypothetical protein